MISVILPYRNRDIIRVERCLDSLDTQTFKNFEVVFIDNGSDGIFSEEVKKIVTSYSFCKYVYTNSNGLVWSRSYTLNVGLNTSSRDTIIIADIDLIFDPEFIRKISTLTFNNTFYNYHCIYLPEKYNYNLLSWSKTGFQGFSNSGQSRGLLIINKNDLININGYDEYYQQWGVEDDDVVKRLNLIGLTQHYLDANQYVSLHQWHKESYTNFPTMWYLQMLNYCGTQQDSKRNLNGFGRIIEKNERFNFQEKSNDKETVITLNKDLSITGFNEIIKTFFESKPEEIIKISFDTPDDFITNGLNKKIKNMILRYFIKSPQLPNQNSVLSKSYLTTETLFDFIVYFICVNRQYIKDYYIDHQNNKFLLFYIKKA